MTSEEQYLDTVRWVRSSNAILPDRTGVGSQQRFGGQMRFDLAEGFPLLTTKQVNLKSIIYELMWFLSGSTNNDDLLVNGVKIWNEWALPDGDLGPVYGAQWRRWLTHRWVSETRPRTLLELLSEALQVKESVLAADLFGMLNIYRDQQQVSLAAVEQQYPSLRLSERLAEAGITTTVTEQRLKEERIDQIAELIENLKTQPFSRRHVISAWNPADLPNERIGPQANVENGRMALATCHCLFQFYVDYRELSDVLADAGETLQREFAEYTKTLTQPSGAEQWKEAIAFNEQLYKFFEDRGVPTKRLSCELYQRSADLMVGVPFNIASYALLTMMVAQVVGMVPGDFVHTFGNVHIYVNHFKGADEQVQRKPYPLPKMRINPAVKDIDGFRFEDFELVDYQHHEKIVYQIAV